MDEKFEELTSDEAGALPKKSRKNRLTVFDSVQPDLGLGTLVEGASSLAQGIAGTGRNLGERVSRIMPGGGKDDPSSAGGFSGETEASSSILTSLQDSVARTASAVVDGTGSALSATTGGIGRAVSATTEGIGQVASGAGSLASGAGNMLSSAGEVAGQVLSTVGDVAGVAGEVAGAAGEAAGDILGSLGDILN